MRVSWVFSSQYKIDPAVDIEMIKSVGPSWGSWKTWRSCSTDNVICYDLSKCRELVSRAFQAVCNFYVPKKFYQELGRPLGIKMFDGEFTQEVDEIEDIISLHLAAQTSDLVLMSGFILNIPDDIVDRYDRHKITNYHGMLRSLINNNPQTQWVAVDHQLPLDKNYQTLSNLTCDKMENALKLLI